MTDLIASHFARLRHMPLFRITLGAAAVTGLFLDYDTALGALIVPAALCAVLFGLFFGTEHTDGGMRAKIAAGHSRGALYLAAQTTATAVGLALTALSGTGVLFTAVFRRWRTPPDAEQTALAAVTVVLAMALLCAGMTALCMLVRRRAVLTLSLVLAVLVLLTVSGQVRDMVRQYDGHWSVEGTALAVSQAVYVPPAEPPAALAFLNGSLPFCQAALALELEDFRLTLLSPLYSLAALALVTTLGLTLFRRKDLP